MSIEIRPLPETDIQQAYQIYKLAFGTFLGIPDPSKFAGDAALVPTRYNIDPSAVFGAYDDGKLVGVNFATRWGSQGGFGPLVIDPEYWDKGIASMLMGPAMDQLDDWNIDHACIYTHTNSPKHLALYQKFGFWPRFLTAIMSCPVSAPDAASEAEYFSELSDADKWTCLDNCREVTDDIYKGLDLESEIRSVDNQKLGETVLIKDSGGLAGFAVCHVGPGAEAPRGICYVKFGMVCSGNDSLYNFNRLLDAIFDLSAKRGLKRISAGMNLSRQEAYLAMTARGFRTDMQGVAMHRPNEAGYNRPGVFVMDDRR